MYVSQQGADATRNGIGGCLGSRTKRYNAAHLREAPFGMTGWPCRGPRQ